MAISNICLAKHVGGQHVQPSEISVGLELYFANNTGGVTRHKCVSFDGNTAVFKSTNKDWPGEIRIELNVPDFTTEDFEALSDALSNFQGFNRNPTDGQRMLVHRAKSLGYAFCVSYTQAGWTQCGIDKFNALKVLG